VRFLIDECVSPDLCPVAHAAGHEAYHVAHHGWAALKDPHLVRKAIEHGLIIVTNNRDDFIKRLGSMDLHTGLVVILKHAQRDNQVAYFATVLEAINNRSDLINTVVEVDEKNNVAIYEMPRLK
jgi:predicted nuclease of predicted toxin-antitoxin system